MCVCCAHSNLVGDAARSLVFSTCVRTRVVYSKQRKVHGSWPSTQALCGSVATLCYSAHIPPRRRHLIRACTNVFQTRKSGSLTISHARQFVGCLALFLLSL